MYINNIYGDYTIIIINLNKKIYNYISVLNGSNIPG